MTYFNIDNRLGACYISNELVVIDGLLSDCRSDRMGEAMTVAEVPELIKQLYQVVDRLEVLFEGRSFTPDGHLVGSIGEVLAAHTYALTLMPSSTESYDALTASGIQVQIKATQGNKVAMYSEPVHLLVLQLNRDGSFLEVYNGPGSEPWSRAGCLQKNGQRSIGCSSLIRLMRSVPEHQRINRVL